MIFPTGRRLYICPEGHFYNRDRTLYEGAPERCTKRIGDKECGLTSFRNFWIETEKGNPHRMFTRFVLIEPENKCKCCGHIKSHARYWVDYNSPPYYWIVGDGVPTVDTEEPPDA